MFGFKAKDIKRLGHLLMNLIIFATLNYVSRTSCY